MYAYVLLHMHTNAEQLGGGRVYTNTTPHATTTNSLVYTNT